MVFSRIEDVKISAIAASVPEQVLGHLTPGKLHRAAGPEPYSDVY